MTDAELCARVQAGDREAAGEIQSRHARLVVHIIVKEGYPNTDRVEQAGRIGLHKAALGFRPERSRPGARRPFANYAGTSIRREMGKEVKAMGLDLRAGRGHVMAITRYDYRFWKELRAENELPWFPFVLELGQANWYGDLHPDCLVTDVRELVCGANVGPLLARLREPGTPEEPLAFIQAEVFYRALLRPNAMDAVDLHGTPRATIADLNLPQPLVGYSVVINTGTGEHVYDQSQFFRTCHTACTVAGLMVHMMPCWGWLDHGFYNYHPTFVADLAVRTGLEQGRHLIGPPGARPDEVDPGRPRQDRGGREAGRADGLRDQAGRGDLADGTELVAGCQGGIKRTKSGITPGSGGSPG
jgi:hypothetical protein